jgi:branched-chain amino acid transport system ATP-binding protein
MGIARTFQSVKIFGNLPVITNISLGSLFGQSKPASHSEVVRESNELLEFLKLEEVQSIAAKELTLVSQKRLEVARALATKPELLLLDELMAGLNPTEVAESMELVSSIRNKGTTIIMVEHVMKAIMGICDRIIVLHHGEKIAEGTPQDISKSKTVVEVYLGE